MIKKEKKKEVRKLQSLQYIYYWSGQSVPEPSYIKQDVGIGVAVDAVDSSMARPSCLLLHRSPPEFHPPSPPGSPSHHLETSEPESWNMKEFLIGLSFPLQGKTHCGEGTVHHSPISNLSLSQNIGNLPGTQPTTIFLDSLAAFK